MDGRHFIGRTTRGWTIAVLLFTASACSEVTPGSPRPTDRGPGSVSFVGDYGGPPLADATSPSVATQPMVPPAGQPGPQGAAGMGASDSPTSADALPMELALASDFPSVHGSWDAPGPYATVEEPAGPAHQLFRPAQLGTDGLRHPVLLWGNGTLMPTSSYAALLTHWASHGFVVVAANSTNAGTGAEMLQGLEWLQASPLAANVDMQRVGASGHSQGGSGAIVAGSDGRVAVSIPIEPGPSYVGSDVSVDGGGLQGPSFLIAGGADGIVSPSGMVQPRYDAASQVQAVYGIHATADHFAPTGDAIKFRGYTVAFFRAHLMDDPEAYAEFYGASCGICGDAEWSIMRNYP